MLYLFHFDDAGHACHADYSSTKGTFSSFSSIRSEYTVKPDSQPPIP
jgi:hypothetical protein